MTSYTSQFGLRYCVQCSWLCFLHQDIWKRNHRSKEYYKSQVKK